MHKPQLRTFLSFVFFFQFYVSYKNIRLYLLNKNNNNKQINYLRNIPHYVESSIMNN